MKISLFFVSLLFMSSTVSAQYCWYNPQSQEKAIQNQGWNEDGGNYYRLPMRAKKEVRSEVWNLACQSAGLSIRFKTNATDIKVRYVVTGGFSMPHMPSTGVSGIDLYRVNKKSTDFCFGNYSFGDTIRYSYHIDRGNLEKEGSDYVMYLPLYNGVKFFEIGIPESNKFEFSEPLAQKPIVLYGTSIAQGACASRPGMAWGNILGRSLNRPLINLGFSGNGKLEREVLNYINEVDASVYLIDCMANLNNKTAEEVRVLVKNAVHQIRSKHATPILLIEHAGYSNGTTNEERYTTYVVPNKGQKIAYQELIKEGVKGLYYLSHDELGCHPDSWVDYVHPSDFGMVQQAKAVEKKLVKLLKLK